MNKYITKFTAVKIITIFSFLPAFSQIHKSDLEQDGFSGKVNEVKTIHYRVEKGVRGEPNPTFIDVYDQNGRKTEHSYFFIKDLGFKKKCTWKYDVKGNLIEDSCEGSTSKKQYDQSGNLIKLERYSEDGSLVETIIKQYDQANNEIQSKTYNADTTNPYKSSQSKYTDGRLAEVLEYYSKPEDFTKQTYSYNQSQKISEALRFTKDGLQSKIQYFYDKSSNLIEEKHFDGNDNSRFTVKYQFDKNNNLVSKQYYDNNGKLREGLKYSATYNAASQLVKFLESDEDGNYDRFMSEYNASGELIKKTFYSYDDKISKISVFNYDKIGNPIEEKILEDGVETYLIMHEIVYY